MEVSALKPTALPGPKGPAPLLRLQSDERLIALTRRGQEAAFEALFSRYHARLLSFCRHMLGSKEDAEDVLQEVFAAAFNAILADTREINVRPWLYRIARNRSLNHLRKASAIGVDSMDIHYAEHGMSTGEKVLRRESFRQLIGDVRQLPETQRTALLLREIDALSYEQIAQAMETTVPSVKSLLVRARISLAEAAEARELSCAEVRHQLGEAAEGLVKIEAPARRHLRDCERCRGFRKHLKDNNHALAAILPVGPLLLLKKLVLTKFGSASAGGAHMAGAGGATAGVSAAGAGAGASGGFGLGGLATAGAGALATKTAATLAAAALVTAGAVEANHATGTGHRRRASSLTASTYGSSAAGILARHRSTAPVVVHSTAQPTSTIADRRAKAAARRAHRHPPEPATIPVAPTTSTADATTPVPIAAGPDRPTIDATRPAATQVTTESTPLPPSTTTAVQPVTGVPPTNEGAEAETPLPPPAEAPAAETPEAPEAPPTTTTTSASDPPPTDGATVPSTSTPAGTPQPIVSPEAEAVERPGQ